MAKGSNLESDSIGEADYNPSLRAQPVVCGARADLALEGPARNGTIIQMPLITL